MDITVRHFDPFPKFLETIVTYSPDPSIVIAGTFTVDPIALPLRHWMNWLGWNWNIRLAPYGQAFQQLLDPSSLMASNDSGASVLLIRLTDWTSDANFQKLRQTAQQFLDAIDGFQARSNALLLIGICESNPSDSKMSNEISVCEQWLCQALESRLGVQVIKHDDVEYLYPVIEKHDAFTLKAAHIPYTQELYAALAGVICRRISAAIRPPFKVVVLDCDQTLWDGVCAEDGPKGIRLSAERLQFQHRMKELSNAGMLLCICSKNQVSDVWEVFDSHAEMVLRRDDLIAHRINWQPKSDNLRSLAQELNLGLDSFVFIDDNPIECAEVKSNCPEVLTLQLPNDAITAFLKHTWAFDLQTTGDEDRQRTMLYAQERQRKQFFSSAMTLDEFIDGLELRIQISDLQEKDVERVSQLTQRTNQMNFTTVRRSATEIRRLCSDGHHQCFVVRVKDRFGDYGLVGAIICDIESSCLRLDTFLLSCRALGRRVELRMLEKLVQLAVASDCEFIQLAYSQTEKNQPAFNLLQSLGVLNEPENSKSLQRVLAVGELEQRIARAMAVTAPAATDTGEFSRQFSSESGLSHSQGVKSNDSQQVMTVAAQMISVERIMQRIASEASPRPELAEAYVPPNTPLQKQVAEICQRVMNLDRVGVDDSLKNLGLSSLHAVQILGSLHYELNSELSISELFAMSTVRQICSRIQNASQTYQTGIGPSLPLITGSNCGSPKDGDSMAHRSETRAGCPELGQSNAMAVIGLSGRFPGADSVTELWKNLVQGKCSIADIPDDQLNLPPDSPLRRNPNLVRRAASIAEPEYFDAKFFGIFPKEAQVMDPQHRIMIECCWHALEDAGYQPDNIAVPVGLFAGCYMDTYILASLATNPRLLESLANSFHGGDLQTELGNDKDYLVTRVSYLLNLRGPAMTVQTACSTSLVAIAQACQSLMLRQCDMALAGGVTLKLPQNRGYLYAEGGMVSPDGVCRTFDSKARGTVFGEGAGVVVLKRLDDAIADGDDIYAVIKGWGLNNDGRAKIGYTAPSIEGQYQAIASAHQMAGITADTIGYMEAHGTGTALGDPIEVDALTRAFRLTTSQNQYCAIGSLKTNIGHLDVAAGVSGLIKVCLSLRNELIPPSLKFETPNPNIDFESSPFFVNTQLRPWQRTDQVRRAGLSSFGVGGTNAHIVIEEAPVVSIFGDERPYKLLPLSARSPKALRTVCHQLAEILENNPALSLADVAYTLQTGRKKFNYSKILVSDRHEKVVAELRQQDALPTSCRHQIRRDVASVWMFPGQGSQYINMGRELFESEPVFAEALNSCFSILETILGFDLREKLFVDSKSKDDLEYIEILKNTEFAQPAIFSVSYAYAQWLIACGIRPQFMIGHSVGEFVAACLAGVFSLADAMKIVVVRARLMQQIEPGMMLAVRVSEKETRQLLEESQLISSLSIAAVNSPVLCVVSGTETDVSAFQDQLDQREIAYVPLHTSHAFHSAMMEPVVEPFAKVLSELKLSPPRLPIISTVTGQLLTAQQACNPMYWAKHLRETVRFSDALANAISDHRCVLLEVGPGQTLSTLARQQPGLDEGWSVLSVSPHAKQQSSISQHLWQTLGSLWEAGVPVDFLGAYRLEQRRRLHLPGYPFERQRYWFDQISVNPEPEIVVEDELDHDGGESDSGVSERNFKSLSAASQLAKSDTAGSLQSAQRSVSHLLSDSLQSGYSESLGTTKPDQAVISAEIGENEPDFMESLIRQQLAIMQQQLECWQTP